MNDFERNCLSHWFPLIEAAGLPVPRTTIIRAEHDLTCMLDGEKPEGWDEFHALVQAACYDHGLPCFLRTGQGSGKHEWSDCCYVTDAEKIGRHIAALVEWSHSVDMFGLPHDVWAVRDLIPTKPLFVCERYGGFPVVREFRLFMHSGQMRIDWLQPYWPPPAVEQGGPDREDWREILDEANVLSDAEFKELNIKAFNAVQAVGGYWSVDFLQAADGEWWLCDMALGERSYRWDPNEQ
jgi:hypothetical protein